MVSDGNPPLSTIGKYTDLNKNVLLIGQ